MFTITNLSNNALTLTLGRIAPRETATRETVDAKERNYESRGWLRITIDEVEETAASAKQTSAGSASSTTTVPAESPKSEAKNTKKPAASPAKED